MPLLLFENQLFVHSIKEAIPKEKIVQGRDMDESVAESSIGNSYEARRTRRRAAIEASIKKVLEPEPSQSTIQALRTQHENVQKRKGEILTEPEVVKRLKSGMMTREKKRLQRRQGVHLI